MSSCNVCGRETGPDGEYGCLHEDPVVLTQLGPATSGRDRGEFAAGDGALFEERASGSTGAAPEPGDGRAGAAKVTQ